MDPLADVLDLSRVKGALLGSVIANAPWGIALPQSEGASCHAVLSGTAWLELDGRAPLQLMPGDVLLLPAGTPHHMVSAPGVRCESFDRAMKERRMTPTGDFRLPGPGAKTTFVCAGYDYDLDVAGLLMGSLPEVLHVPADPVQGRAVASLVELLAAEVGATDAGSRAAGARLIDLLLIAAIRHWAATQPELRPPFWLTALRDPLIAHVLGLLHSRPAEPWTLQALAGEVHVSRATLARRFNASLGEPPLAYLTRWRMCLAAQRLKHTDASVESIGHDVGYRSEYAFNRAFARHRGQPPGRYRLLARTA
ncbi:MAG TPA: AraC family transcriptional regulator [Solirubrobacteraceae bacterium]|jgi:AraC-like DNA-binding protein|nr:AraC family transcriptional regulator [Solirubrobacteraceae bacterium]